MSQLKRAILESVSKLKKTLLSEEGPVASPAKILSPEEEAERAKHFADRAKQSAMQYTTMFDASTRMRADDIIKKTLTRGDAGAVDATYINDLDMRWSKGSRSLNTPKLRSYDYMIQMLASLYNTPNGENVEVGGQTFPVTPGMKQNIYAGLLKMFNLQDTAKRWRWFMFGSDFPGVSMVSPQYRPRIPMNQDGTKNFAEVDNRLSDLNNWLAGGALLNMMKQPGFYDKGFAYALTSLRNKFNELQRDKNRGKIQTKDHDDYTASDAEYAKTTRSDDSRMLGYKDDLGGKAEPDVDLRHVGTKDGGEDPGFHNIVRFVNAIKTDMKGKTDLDVSDPTVYSMADHIVSKMCDFVQQHFDKAPLSKGYPIIPDLFRAYLTKDPKSLNFICRDPKYKDIYPNAYAAYLPTAQSAPSSPTITYTNWHNKYYASMVVPELDRVTKQFVDDMDIDMDLKAKDTLDFKDPEPDTEKATYGDYADPKSMVKGVDKKTGKPVSFDDYDDYYASLEETDAQGGDPKAAIANSVMSAFSRLMAPE